MDLKDIKTQTLTLVGDGELLLSYKVTNEDSFNSLFLEYNSWVDKCLNMYNSTLPKEYSTQFAQGLKRVRFEYNSVAQSFLNNDIRGKIIWLNQVFKMIEISDELINPQIIEQERRDNFTIAQKETLILYKLYQYNDYNPHEVNYILKANGLKNVDYQEVAGMVKELTNAGYIDAVPTARRIMARITSEGKKEIETLLRKVTSQQNSDVVSNKDIETINKRLDEVVEWLKKNDLGNEIIFDELQELKDAGKKLNIKNWQQLVKGKLYDVASTQLTGLSIDALKDIFKILTGEDVSKLLS